MVFGYMQLPTLVGIGKITVKLELPASGGLYRFSNVTYRGVEVGKVTEMDVSRDEATATLTLNTSPKIPADLTAEVRSVSAVGEQYVELLPRTESPPYLQDGSVISMQDTKIPQQVGPMLDQVSTLINSIPKEKLSGLVDESFNAFNGSGYDLGSLIDSSSKISGDLNRVGDQSSALIEDTGPLLDSQAQTTDDLRLWARSLAGITGQVVTNDPQVRTLLHRDPTLRTKSRGCSSRSNRHSDIAGEHDDIRSGR
jgi:virulence factor Mce-like protein